VRADLADLVASYADVLKRRHAEVPLAIETLEPMMTVEDALARIRRGLGHAPGWESLLRYLPDGTLAGLRAGRLAARVQLAATLMATLELAREGVLVLRQSRPFGPIYIRAAGGDAS
jgi:segregation and condensation protein A